MIDKKKPKIFVIDTSAILSGKTINIDNNRMVTVPSVSQELKPGGRDYQNFQFLKETGLTISSPSDESINRINIVSTETGDNRRLSPADKEILALALDIKKDEKNEPIILTDDYSIQNVADFLNIKYEHISQSGITKRFKWTYQCLGCGKKYKEHKNICSICGAKTKNIVSQKKNIER